MVLKVAEVRFSNECCWIVAFGHLGSPSRLVKALLLSVYMNVRIYIHIYLDFVGTYAYVCV